MATTYKKPLYTIVATIHDESTITVTDTTTAANAANAIAEFNACAQKGYGVVHFVTNDGTTIVPWHAIVKVVITSEESDSITRADAVCDEEARMTDDSGNDDSGDETEYSISLNKESLINSDDWELVEGSYSGYQLVATTVPADAEVTWTSDNNNVTVENGYVTVYDDVEGAVVTASITDGTNTYSATCTITATLGGSEE